jgi:hypothetical protein
MLACVDEIKEPIPDEAHRAITARLQRIHDAAR